MALKPLRRPDWDPLEVQPRERFELSTLTPGGLRGYQALLHEQPDPWTPPYPVQLMKRLPGLTAKQKMFEVQQAIYAISWVYRVPRAQVEEDLRRAMIHFLQLRLSEARTDGSMVPLESPMAQEAIAIERGRR